MSATIQSTEKKFIERTLKNITSTATSVRTYAFYKCTSLKTVTLPDVESIGAYAFRNCSALTTITVGTNKSTVCTLGANAFASCTSLTKIKVPSALVNDYKAATNWSTYASKIVAA